MTLIDTEPVVHQLESALNAGCAALVALQGAPLRPAGAAEDGGVQGQLTQIIMLLRSTISELRAAHDEEASPLAFGFVLEGATVPGAAAA